MAAAAVLGWEEIAAALAAYGARPWLVSAGSTISGAAMLAACSAAAGSGAPGGSDGPASGDAHGHARRGSHGDARRDSHGDARRPSHGDALRGAAAAPPAPRLVRPGRLDAAALLRAWAAGAPALLASDRDPKATQPQLPNAASLPPDTATLIPTSGSSGAPKLAAHALAQHLASARAAGSYFGLQPEHTWLLALPLHHVGGLAVLLRTLLFGARCALAPAGLAAALAAHRPTHVSLVSTQLIRLLDDPQATAQLAAAQAVLVGGGPLPVAVRRRALERGVQLVVSYGATETSSMVAAESDPQHVARPRCAGRPLPPHRVAVRDGAIRVGGPALFLGYATPQGLVDPRDEDGLFSTGDLGELDADDRLHVHGRADRMLISGGENIHPEEIEAALLQFDGIVEAVVVPTDDPEFGQRPVACLRGAAAAARGRDALLRHLEATLPRFKIPVRFARLPEPAEQPQLKRSWAALARIQETLPPFFG